MEKKNTQVKPDIKQKDKKEKDKKDIELVN